MFEIASLVLIITIVAFAFRSLLAPLVVVAVAGVGYLVYNPLLTALAAAFGFEVPTQSQPVLLALLLGVVTDYCVLLFSTYREELLTGVGKQPAARQALAREASVVAVAGLTVAVRTIALLAAPFAIFRGLGPALALTVLVGMLVCLTSSPAVMVIVGWRLFTVLPVRGLPSRGGLVAEPARSTRWIERLTDVDRQPWRCSASSSCSACSRCRCSRPGWTCRSPRRCRSPTRWPVVRIFSVRPDCAG